MKATLDRRTFLRGSGGVLIGLPALESIASANPRSGPAVPVRMVCVATHFGFVPRLFFPEQTGFDYEAPLYIRELERHRRRFTIFSNLDHGSEGVGGHGGVHAFLSGVLSKHAKGFAEGNISVDQKAAAHAGTATRYPSLQLGSSPDGGSQISWSRSGIALPTINSLAKLHAMLFQTPDAGETSLLHKLHRERRSVLDLVRTDAAVLKRRIGREDQERIDQYFTSVREMEERLIRTEAWLDRQKPEVDYRLPEDGDGKDFAERVPLFYDLMSLALQTDSTRVITLSLTDLGVNSGGFEITRGYHQLTHHGKVESYIDELSIIERFHTRQFGAFLDKLDAVREPNGRTLLDNTMALLGSGMGNASTHSNKNLPLLLAGGGFKHGRHLGHKPGATPACNLFVSMLQRFGLEADRFNRSTGTLTGLETA